MNFLSFRSDAFQKWESFKSASFFALYFQMFYQNVYAETGIHIKKRLMQDATNLWRFRPNTRNHK